MTTATSTPFKVAPVLASTVATVLLLALLFRAADIFLLLFVAVVFSLFLGAVRDALVQRLRLPPAVAFAASVLGTLASVAGLITLLVPPVVGQTQQLIRNLPTYVSAWQAGAQRVLLRYPRVQELWAAESERLLSGLVTQAEEAVAGILPQVVGVGHAVVSIVSVLVMAIFLALHPGTYREWLIALFPPARRDLVRDTLRDIANTLRAWIVGQLLAMTVLAILTAAGLYLLDVPYWLTFGVFTGAVAIIPFFGTLISSILPALFVLGGGGVFGLSPGVHALLVMILGFVIHILEANVVIPIITAKQVEMPPVLSIMAVLVVGRLLGPLALPVAVPLLAVIIVLVRRVLINRVYGTQGTQRTGRERVLVLRVPAPDGGVIVTADPPLDVLRLSGGRRTA
ncbi:MAG: AI-2E family transporter [Gemmatimonadetes bacterium]|nr:AI-2E family transporter [Gemmatimonadota bacterium]MCC6773427.1 AI-2E family transporter [Gemmatimonadaceae bacterium]